MSKPILPVPAIVHNSTLIVEHVELWQLTEKKSHSSLGVVKRFFYVSPIDGEKLELATKAEASIQRKTNAYVSNEQFLSVRINTIMDIFNFDMRRIALKSASHAAFNSLFFGVTKTEKLAN